MSAYQRVIDALAADGRKVTTKGNVTRAKCPGHDGQSDNSLIVTGIDGQVLLHCKASCDIATIVDALGLAMPDLFDNPKGKTYNYTDLNGTVLRVVHRTPDKQFRQSGNTSSDVLYGLPQLTEAISNGSTVYLTEGEKDADALNSIGLCAATSPQGVDSWHKIDPTPLYGGNIVVIPDNDPAGDKYACAIRDTLEGHVESLTFLHAAEGKDAADHIAAGHGLADFIAYTPPTKPTLERAVTLTPASTIKVRPVHWLWDGRVALGTLALLAGREGIGKSTIGYTIAADVTRGRLHGKYHGTPKSVIVAATEDSWAHTIVPRLMAANADLDKVFRVDVTTVAGIETGLNLPRDLKAVEQGVREVDAALILLDPLMSRLDSKLDTHRDGDVRQALEPLVKVADDTGASILGLIHINKSHSTDPLTTIMASRAFAAVARGVLFVMTDPDDENVRLIGTPKNNLGKSDLPTLTFTIESEHVADTDEGPVWTGRVKWIGESTQSIRDALEASADSSDVRSAGDEAADWLEDWLTMHGGVDESAVIKKEGAKAGHDINALKRARKKLKAPVSAKGFPRRTYWELAGTQSETPVGSDIHEAEPTEPTEPTGESPIPNNIYMGRSEPVGAVGSVGSVGARSRKVEPTEESNECTTCGQLLLLPDGRDQCARCLPHIVRSHSIAGETA